MKCSHWLCLKHKILCTSVYLLHDSNRIYQNRVKPKGLIRGLELCHRILPVSFYRSLGSKQCWVIAVVIVAIVVGVIGIIVVVEIIVHRLASSINCIGVWWFGRNQISCMSCVTEYMTCNINIQSFVCLKYMIFYFLSFIGCSHVKPMTNVHNEVECHIWVTKMFASLYFGIKVDRRT